jgi:hypothetical protein
MDVVYGAEELLNHPDLHPGLFIQKAVFEIMSKGNLGRQPYVSQFTRSQGRSSALNTPVWTAGSCLIISFAWSALSTLMMANPPELKAFAFDPGRAGGVKYQEILAHCLPHLVKILFKNFAGEFQISLNHEIWNRIDTEACVCL